MGFKFIWLFCVLIMLIQIWVKMQLQLTVKNSRGNFRIHCKVLMLKISVKKPLKRFIFKNTKKLLSFGERHFLESQNRKITNDLQDWEDIKSLKGKMFKKLLKLNWVFLIYLFYFLIRFASALFHYYLSLTFLRSFTLFFKH